MDTRKGVLRLFYFLLLKTALSRNPTPVKASTKVINHDPLNKDTEYSLPGIRDITDETKIMPPSQKVHLKIKDVFCFIKNPPPFILLEHSL